MSETPATVTGAAHRDWYLESLRVTVFRSRPIEDEGGEWLRLVGADPDVEVRTKAEGAPRYVAATSHDLGTLRLHVDSSKTKLDWLIGAVGLPDAPPESPIVGRMSDLLPQLHDFVASLARANVERSKRLAIGLILLGPEFGDRSDAYASLAPYLPAVTVDPKASDFMYQINRPRGSTLDSVSVNRLSLWTVARLLDLELGQSGQPVRHTARFRRRVALDVNTSPEFAGEFDLEKQEPLLRELLDLAVEIAERGDIE